MLHRTIYDEMKAQSLFIVGRNFVIGLLIYVVLDNISSNYIIFWHSFYANAILILPISSIPMLYKIYSEMLDSILAKYSTNYTQ